MTFLRKIFVLRLFLALFIGLGFSACSAGLTGTLFGTGLSQVANGDESDTEGLFDEVGDVLADAEEPSPDDDSFADVPNTVTTTGTNRVTGESDAEDPDGRWDESTKGSSPTGIPVTIAKEDGDEDEDCTAQEAEMQTMMISMHSGNSQSFQFAAKTSYLMRPSLSGGTFKSGRLDQTGDDDGDGEIRVCELAPEDGGYKWRRVRGDLAGAFEIAVLRGQSDGEEEVLDVVTIQPDGTFTIRSGLLDVDEKEFVAVTLLPKGSNVVLNETAVVFKKIDGLKRLIPTRDLDETLFQLGF